MAAGVLAAVIFVLTEASVYQHSGLYADRWLQAGLILPYLIAWGIALSAPIGGPAIFILGMVMWLAGDRVPRLRHPVVWITAGTVIAPLGNWLFEIPLIDRTVQIAHWSFWLSFAGAGAVAAATFRGVMVRTSRLIPPPPEA